VDMPQMAANGLSENWLFKHCGDQHWRALCESLGTRSSDLRDDAGLRLYPTFVAVSARYSRPLSQVRENDIFEDSVDLSHFGRSFFSSKVQLADPSGVLTLDMTSAFVARVHASRNELRRSTPAATLAYRCREMDRAPHLLDLSKKMRNGELARYELVGRTMELGPTGGLDLTRRYEPSPYVDFNGANLLYFASYPTICDSLERAIIQGNALVRLDRDWSLATSTKARDVFYYRNLDIGIALVARLNRFEELASEYLLHTTLLSESDGLPIADIFTLKSACSSTNETVDQITDRA